MLALVIQASKPGLPNPASITTIIALAAFVVLAVTLVRRASLPAQLSTLAIGIIALGVATWFEFTTHRDPCAHFPSLRLNEVCASGQRCGIGGEFVEVFNPSADSVSLACFALQNMRTNRSGIRVPGNPVVLEQSGFLRAGQVRAWREDELGFKLSLEKRDRLQLLRLQLEPGRALRYVEVERPIYFDTSRAYWYRPGDEGAGVFGAPMPELLSFDKRNSSR